MALQINKKGIGLVWKTMIYAETSTKNRKKLYVCNLNLTNRTLCFNFEHGKVPPLSARPAAVDFTVGW